MMMGRSQPGRSVLYVIDVKCERGALTVLDLVTTGQIERVRSYCGRTNVCAGG